MKARHSAKIAKYMKGGSATDCRADRGTVKAKRSTQATPITVDGAAARPRLDRPMRKRADGGSISEDSKREIERLRAERPNLLLNPNSALTGVGVGLAGKAYPKPLRAIGAALGSIGGKRMYDDADKFVDSTTETDRIRRGEAAPGKEDRAKGGRVKK